MAPKVLPGPLTFVPSTEDGRVPSFAAVHRTAAIIVCEESAMVDRIRRAWSLALAIAPIGAIALVEAAMRRW
jgi:hypothetical protein